jgi:ankyrin repeat protein
MLNRWHLAILISAATLCTGAVAERGMPALVEAAKDADWPHLRQLIGESASVNALYGDGSAALHWASYHDNLEIVELLLSAGANVDVTTDLGVTPLWLAAENGNTELVEKLLAAGANANVALRSGETVLMTATAAGNAEVISLLLAAGAEPNHTVVRGQTALMWAAGRGYGDVVASLIDYGADVHARSESRTQFVKTEKPQDSPPDYKVWVEDGGNTPLMFAARSGDLRSVQLLLDAGSDVNEVSAFGTSPAMMATHSGNIATLSAILEAGADPDSAVSGHTALHVAVLRGNNDAVKALLDHGASIDARVERASPTRRQSEDYHFHETFVGATPLWLAARFREPDIMATLLAHGADPMVVNNVRYPDLTRDGQPTVIEEGDISVLMAALGMGNRRLAVSWGTQERRAGRIDTDTEALVYNAASLAIEAGADIDLLDASKQSALSTALARRYESVVRLLREAGAAEEL